MFLQTPASETTYSGCLPSGEREIDISPYWTGGSSWKMNVICANLREIGRQQKSLLGPKIDSPPKKQQKQFPAISCLPNYKTARESVCFCPNRDQLAAKWETWCAQSKSGQIFAIDFICWIIQRWARLLGENKFACPSGVRHWLISLACTACFHHRLHKKSQRKTPSQKTRPAPRIHQNKHTKKRMYVRARRKKV